VRIGRLQRKHGRLTSGWPLRSGLGCRRPVLRKSNPMSISQHVKNVEEHYSTAPFRCLTL
jgi:hypothetical protein